ncbi:hypothetical protein BAUCODRAFT_35060 [Baudoinia panamericana UAMH 10762]|uniref:Major facilitator superfamily (MFS) profile domain-containing protein n=1 Tax=Baudoinia panamericana (strain UAMH 10762) TaxID=717646 RepID=M2N8D1_BAUPA|nr:uncharacterized protein BAUCODRAFT_35060 [Baudoinia panamericana UAMH 10762]EMC95070.1 hypothetical protein BAUCODRAFT_35060 [Baudoinia panamericana UAMH 10762]
MGFFGKRANDAPPEILNWRLWFGVFVFGLMGAARGLDEGLIGTTASQKSFSKLFGLKSTHLTKIEQANLLSNITSMVQLGSVLGAIVAFYFTDKIGRLWATRQLCVIWIIGIAIFVSASTNGSIGMVYTGRFIAGVGIGQTTVVAPTYLAEISPRFTRGLCVGMFSGAVYLGIMLGYFASWGCSIHVSNTNQLQWVLPNLMHIYFATIIFGLSFLAIESPRWLVKVGQHERATKNLSKLRGLAPDHWYIQSELMDIRDQLEREREATMGTSWLGPIRELVTIPRNSYCLFLSIFAQLLGQWSGANSITIYAPQYFELMGTTGQNEKLFATAVFGVVKFVSAMICALFLIDFIGRKRSLMTGISLQLIAMLYMALFLVIDQTVGNTNVEQSASQRSAAKGAIGMIYISGFGWAMGWNSIQYLINSEIYPLRLRAIGASIAMTFHFVNQYGNSKAVPEMFITLTTGGTMFFFSAVTLLGLGWVWFFLPELANKSLEAVDAVFELPWYLIGRKGKELTEGLGGAVENFGEAKAGIDAVEEVGEVEHKA